ATGIVNASPVFNNCGLALTSSRTVTPYLLAIVSNESPAATICFAGDFGWSVVILAPAKIYNSSSVPLKISRSTLALIPLTRPTLLYGKKAHWNQPRGNKGLEPPTY